MSAVPAALVKACRQLCDRPVVAVLVKSVGVTLALFAAGGAGLWYGLAGIGGAYGVDAACAGVATAVLVPLAMWLLFRVVAVAVLQFFADEVVAAVEARHYPALAERARALPLRREVAVAARGLGRTLAYNLLALSVAAVLLFTGIGPALVFLGVNAVLLGRELTDMAWLRHCGGEPSANPVGAGERVLLGAAVAGLMLVPVAGLIAPLIGAAAGAHLVLRRIDAEARR